MSENILNNKCVFECNSFMKIIIPFPFSLLMNNSSICNENKCNVLTEDARCAVSIPFPCQILTLQSGGVPVLCTLNTSDLLSWKNTSSKVKVNNKAVLTSKSFANCPKCPAGVIKPFFSSTITKETSVLGFPDIPKISVKANCSKSENNANESEKSIVDSEKDKKQAEEKPFAEYCMCDYENCGKTKECKYFNTEVSINNDAGLLRKNFQSERSVEWNEYEKLHNEQNENYEKGGWRIAAHHIISGNQVFMTPSEDGKLEYGCIVKLAKFFEYDVNNAFNCIMLPTSESGFGSKEVINKFASAYDVMALMRRQWHTGGHQYSLDERTLKNLRSYYENHPEQYPSPGNPNFFSNYIDAMKEEMNKISIRKQCWQKNTEYKKNRFINELDSISKKVEKYLLDFDLNPKKSFPFFVSKITVEYAYNLPKKSKVIFIYNTGSRNKAQKFEITKLLKNDLEINSTILDEIFITDKKEDFIYFCENIMYFIIDESFDKSLPFIASDIDDFVVRNINLNGNKPKEYLDNNGHEIYAFIEANQKSYKPVAKIVSTRLGGVNV